MIFKIETEIEIKIPVDGLEPEPGSI